LLSHFLLSPPRAVWLALLLGFIFRHTSLKQLEADLAESNFQRCLGVERWNRGALQLPLSL